MCYIYSLVTIRGQSKGSPQIIEKLDMTIIKKSVFIIAVLLLLARHSVSATPPACLLSCVNSVARDAPGKLHLDFHFACVNRVLMKKCLVDTCPFGNFLSARDHFLGTCIEFIPELSGDYEFNFDVPNPICQTSESSFILLQYNSVHSVDKLIDYAYDDFLDYLADDGAVEEVELVGDDNESADENNESDNIEFGKGKENDEEQDKTEDSEGEMDDPGNEEEEVREDESEIEHNYDEERAIEDNKEDKSGLKEGERERQEDSPDDCLFPDNDEMVLEKCSKNLDFVFAEELARRNAIREFQNIELQTFKKGRNSTENSIYISSFQESDHINTEYYTNYFFKNKNKAFQKALKSYIRLNNTSAFLGSKELLIEKAKSYSETYSSSIPGTTGTSKNLYFEFQFASPEQILKYKVEHENDNKQDEVELDNSVDLFAKPKYKTLTKGQKKKLKENSSNGKGRSTGKNGNNQKRKKQQRQRQKQQDQDQIIAAYRSHYYPGEFDHEKKLKKKIQFSSSIFGSRLDRNV